MTVELDTEVKEHYSIQNLSERILNALSKVKSDSSNYTRDDFSAFDEFHIRGKQATIILANMVPVKEGMKILDLGSGVGGPARTLASEYHTEVVGLELVEEYYQTAKILSELVQMQEVTKFIHGSALDVPFENESFDLVWLQHMSMNILDKKKLFSEVYRVLKNDGKLAFYEICKGSGNSFYFPVPWATNQKINHLISISELLSLLNQLGFKEIITENVTQNSLTWFKGVLEKAKLGPVNPLGLQLVAGDDFGLKAKNIVKNFEEENIEVILGVFEK